MSSSSTTPPQGAQDRRMPLVAALEVLRDWRSDEVVVTTMGTAREWPRLSQHPLDFHHIPSAMGQAPALALGMALAQPKRHVLCLNGDGCMLMNLGSLVTIVAAKAENLSLFICDNGLYEVTGGQATAARQGGADFARLAQGAGFPTVRAFDELSAWRREAADVLAAPGPRCIVWRVEPVGPDYHVTSPGPMGPRLAAFRQALATG